MNVKLFKQLAVIGIGATVVAFSIVNFSIQHYMADGGMAGIQVLIYRFWGVNPGVMGYVMNIPLLFLLWKFFDKETFWMTVYGIFIINGALILFSAMGPIVPFMGEDMMLVAILHGVVLGIGIGLVVRENGTTGGALIVAKVANKFTGVSLAKFLFGWDTVVILLSLAIFLTFENAVYTLIALFICAQVVSKVQEGVFVGYKVMIISDKFEKMKEAILRDLNRGATILHATGAHSGKEKPVIMVAISRKQLLQLKRLVAEVDPESFITVSQTRETHGEGFTFDR